jgi:macrodomain Ter protein organizer (MatP/YcbG family)
VEVILSIVEVNLLKRMKQQKRLRNKFYSNSNQNNYKTELVDDGFFTWQSTRAIIEYQVIKGIDEKHTKFAREVLTTHEISFEL